MASDKILNINIPINMFSILDEILFKVLLLLFSLGRCGKNTKEEDLGENETCFVEIEVSNLSKILNLDYEIVIDALARLVEEGFIVVRETEETEELNDLISYWVDYTEIESLGCVPKDVALYDDTYKISLYPKYTQNISEYLVNIQNENN